MNKKLFLAIVLMHHFPAVSQINITANFHNGFNKMDAFFYSSPSYTALKITNYLRLNASLKKIFHPKRTTVLTFSNLFSAATIAKKYTFTNKIKLAKGKLLKSQIPTALPLVLAIILIISYHKTRFLKKKKEYIELQRESLLKIIELQAEKEISIYYRRSLEELKIAFIKTTEQIRYLKKQINSIGSSEEIAQLRASVILTHKDWLTFKKLFDKSYPNFTKKLVAKNKCLTTAEIRFMMLKKINLSNQDMARSQGVGNNAVHKTNSRIRQKSLCTNEELSALIKTL
jgi:hypothetical protein